MIQDPLMRARLNMQQKLLIAFTAAQVAVVRLRFTEPTLERPYRVPGNVRIRGTEVPIAALVGAPLTLAIWVIAIATHDAYRTNGRM